jgi:hypothetical protein
MRQCVYCNQRWRTTPDSVSECVGTIAVCQICVRSKNGQILCQFVSGRKGSGGVLAAIADKFYRWIYERKNFHNGRL